MLGQYKCQNVSHNDMQIQGVCQNKQCQQPSRRICFQCIKDHQKNDQNFDYSDIKGELEIQQILNEFKYFNVDRMNNIALQCQIQQYLLNIEIIEYVKLWNYKYNKIHEILEQLQQFNNNQWKQINIHNYLDNEKKNIGQQKLLYIDDLKDNYIKDIIKQNQYKDINIDTQQNKLSIDIVQTFSGYQKQLFSEITSNDLFKQKHSQNEDIVITICELMLRQGWDLKTDFLLFNEKDRLPKNCCLLQQYLPIKIKNNKKSQRKQLYTLWIILLKKFKQIYKYAYQFSTLITISPDLEEFVIITIQLIIKNKDNQSIHCLKVIIMSVIGEVLEVSESNSKYNLKNKNPLQNVDEQQKD